MDENAKEKKEPFILSFYLCFPGRCVLAEGDRHSKAIVLAEGGRPS
jgi:hypothetical protein